MVSHGGLGCRRGAAIGHDESASIVSLGRRRAVGSGRASDSGGGHSTCRRHVGRVRRTLCANERRRLADDSGCEQIRRRIAFYASVARIGRLGRSTARQQSQRDQVQCFQRVIIEMCNYIIIIMPQYCRKFSHLLLSLSVLVIFFLHLFLLLVLFGGKNRVFIDIRKGKSFRHVVYCQTHTQSSSCMTHVMLSRMTVLFFTCLLCCKCLVVLCLRSCFMLATNSSSIKNFLWSSPFITGTAVVISSFRSFRNSCFGERFLRKISIW